MGFSAVSDNGSTMVGSWHTIEDSILVVISRHSGFPLTFHTRNEHSGIPLTLSYMQTVAISGFSADVTIVPTTNDKRVPLEMRACLLNNAKSTRWISSRYRMNPSNIPPKLYVSHQTRHLRGGYPLDI